MRFSATLSIALALAATPAAAKSPRDIMFPGDAACYLRQYSKAHLADHPDQMVAQIALGPLAGVPPDPQVLVLTVAVYLRGHQARLVGAAYCESEAGHLVCGMEGDAGSFTLDPAKDGAIKLKVGRHGMSFEGMQDFYTLSGTTGDDRVFLLPRVPADACP